MAQKIWDFSCPLFYIAHAAKMNKGILVFSIRCAYSFHISHDGDHSLQLETDIARGLWNITNNEIKDISLRVDASKESGSPFYRCC